MTPNAGNKGTSPVRTSIAGIAEDSPRDAKLTVAALERSGRNLSVDTGIRSRLSATIWSVPATTSFLLTTTCAIGPRWKRYSTKD
jgi:hypothetical protein